MFTKRRDSICVLVKVIFDKKVVSVFLLLLVIVFVDNFLLRPYFSELDIVEHFLFGFMLSETSSRISKVRALRKLVARPTLRLDLLVRLSGFLIIGGLLWESMEYSLFPNFGFTTHPFFTFPITPDNVDGAVDISVGIFGCLSAWYLAKKTGAR